MTMIDIDDVNTKRLIDMGRDVGMRSLAERIVRDAAARAFRVLWDEADRVTRHFTALRERGRLAAILARAVPPEAMAAAAIAPARGTMRLVENVSIRAGGILHRDGHHWIAQDQLSIMVQQARAAWRPKGDGDVFVSPFTPGQIMMARHYQALVERHDAGGMKCASLEGRQGGSGQGGGFADAFLAEGREIAAIRARIGDGVAMAVRRIRPSQRGSRAAITDRRLVDMVCLGGSDLTAVLRAHGWVKSTSNLMALRKALADALDRMQRYPQKGS